MLDEQLFKRFYLDSYKPMVLYTMEKVEHMKIMPHSYFKDRYSYAEDVVARAFVQLWKEDLVLDRTDSLEWKNKFGGFLKKVIKHHLLDVAKHLKNVKRHRAWEIERQSRLYDSINEGPFDAVENRRLLYLAIDRLPEAEKKELIRYLQNKDQSQLTNTQRVQKSVAIRKVKKMLSCYSK
jgi:RNA polymerase sigma factor (sigma-70 family)